MAARGAHAHERVVATHRASCSSVDAELGAIVQRTPGCLEREVHDHDHEDVGGNTVGTRGPTGPYLPQLPVYVVHYPPLSGRRKRLRGLLRAAGAREVTWVLCGNRDEIGALPPAIQRCLGTDLRFGLPTAKYRFGAPLAPGQISTSLKFLLAFRDIRQRDIDAALMLEDDVMVTPRLWNLLGAFALPSDADILWLSGNWRTWTFGIYGGKFGNASHAPVSGGSRCVVRSQRSLSSPRIGEWDGSYSDCPREASALYARNPLHAPAFLPSSAFVITRRAVRSLEDVPVRGESDMSLSDARRFPCWASAVRDALGNLTHNLTSHDGAARRPPRLQDLYYPHDGERQRESHGEGLALGNVLGALASCRLGRQFAPHGMLIHTEEVGGEEGSMYWSSGRLSVSRS